MDDLSDDQPLMNAREEPPDAMKKDAEPFLKTRAWTPPVEKQKTLF